MRVLVVEDNEVLAASMCDGLGARGPGADVAGTLAGADSAFYLWGEEIGGRVIRELLHNAIAHQGCPALRPRAHAQDGAARGGGERRCRRRPRQARRHERRVRGPRHPRRHPPARCGPHRHHRRLAGGRAGQRGAVGTRCGFARLSSEVRNSEIESIDRDA